jgi:1,6-anhydro-N-acetylmuramate kinase
MAKSGAERMRDYRARQREKRGAVQVMPVAEHEAFREKARQLAVRQRDEIASLQAENAALREQAAGAGVPPCRSCGGELACPRCWRGGEDF